MATKRNCLFQWDNMHYHVNGTFKNHLRAVYSIIYLVETTYAEALISPCSRCLFFWLHMLLFSLLLLSVFESLRPAFLSHTLDSDYSCVAEMSSAEVGEERVDKKLSWPLPWQLFQLCGCEQHTELQVGAMGYKR